MKKLTIVVTLFMLTLSGFSQNTTWNHRILTYFFQNNPNDLNATAARAAVRTALQTWQNQAHIYFIEVCSAAESDIDIAWTTNDHGDGHPFDGQGGNYAHGLFPPPYPGAGNMHFDDDEDWTDQFRSGTGQPLDLQTVALHESGHILGLNHTNTNGSVMLAGYRGSNRVLSELDIYNIRELYGAPVQTEIAGPEFICGSSTYTFTETLPAGHTLTWSTDNPLVTVTPGGVVSANSYIGTVTITATVSNGCGSLEFKKTVKTGTLATPTFNGMYNTEGWPSEFFWAYPGTNPCYATKSVSTNVTVPDGCTVTWSLVSPANPSGVWSQSGNNINFIIYNIGGEWIFNVTVTNNCGDVITRQLKWKAQQAPVILPPPGDCLKYSIYPNPSKGKINVGETNRPAPPPCPLRMQFGKEGATIAQMNVYSLKGILLKRAKFDNVKQASVDVSDLVSGQYYIEIIERNGYKERQLFIVQK